MKRIFSIIFFVIIIPLALFNLKDVFFPEEIIIETESEINFSLAEFLKEDQTPFFLNLFEEVREEFVSNKKDFLEVNLAQMKVRVYEQGSVEKEVSILTKGNPEVWGGSSVGLYKILSGGKNIFSIIANAYMPHALHYYGKYFIHGEPYYSWGEKIMSRFSGGCLRLKNEDAQNIYLLTKIGMPVLVIDKEKDDYRYEIDKFSAFPDVFAESYLMADLDSGYIFTEKDSRKQLPIASLTKLMTAVVVAENVDLNRDMAVRDYMLNGYGNTEQLEVNKRYKIESLFYPLLIESSNDAAEVLSYYLGRDRTIELMNEKTSAILMTQTKFTDPSGFDSGNVSTARDLFYLARYIFNNRFPILKITKGENISGSIDFDIDEFYNKNVFVVDSSLIGGKTGYIKKSKQTAVFIFSFLTPDNYKRNIAFMILGSTNRKTDTQRMYAWLMRNYSLTPAE